MSEHLDRALDALDSGLEIAAAPAESSRGWGPYGADDPTLCWRCVANPADDDSPSGLCPGCRSVLVDEDYAAPADGSEDELAGAMARFFGTSHDEARLMLSLSERPPRIPDPEYPHPPGSAGAILDVLAARVQQVNRTAIDELERLSEAFRAAAISVSTFAQLGRALRALTRQIPKVPTVPAKPAHRRRYSR